MEVILQFKYLEVLFVCIGCRFYTTRCSCFQSKNDNPRLVLPQFKKEDASSESSVVVLTLSQSTNRKYKTIKKDVSLLRCHMKTT